jgi:hypothetical protein
MVLAFFGAGRSADTQQRAPFMHMRACNGNALRPASALALSRTGL